MNTDAFLLLDLDFQISTTGLITQRVLNNTWLIFVGTLLGSVFGIMGSIATAMRFVEGVVKKGKKRHEKRVLFNRILDYRRKFDGFFQTGEHKKLEMTIVENKIKKHQNSIEKTYPMAFMDY